MKFTRILGLGIVSLFVLIGVAALIKKKENKEPLQQQPMAFIAPKEAVMPVVESKQEIGKEWVVDRIRHLFSKGSDKLPIVETISYSSRVNWLVGRPAWIADYASHYRTSRHFIARALNGKPDYFTQKIAPGDRFNVLNESKNFYFYLLVDASRCKMHFMYVDEDSHETVLLKSYSVVLGQKDPFSPSGLLTPTGKFKLGDRVAIYRPGVMGYFQNQKVEMIRVFGTRWIPFAEEVGECSDSAKGYGIHGLPCEYKEETDHLVEARETLGQYASDGCIRALKEDIEELYAIVVSRDTFVEIVTDVAQWQSPMPFKYPDDIKAIVQRG